MNEKNADFLITVPFPHKKKLKLTLEKEQHAKKLTSISTAFLTA